jgi:carbamoyl-phosphate synthase large subunit
LGSYREGINFGEAFLKAQISAGSPLPEKGTVFISVNDHHKAEAVEVARRFVDLGFNLVATRGTATALRAVGLQCKIVFKVNEGRPNTVDLLKGGSIQLAIYTTTGAPAFFDERAIRRSAVLYRVPCITTMSGARRRRCRGSLPPRPIRVWSLQEIHEAKKTVA